MGHKVSRAVLSSLTFIPIFSTAIICSVIALSVSAVPLLCSLLFVLPIFLIRFLHIELLLARSFSLFLTRALLFSSSLSRQRVVDMTVFRFEFFSHQGSSFLVFGIIVIQYKHPQLFSDLVPPPVGNFLQQCEKLVSN